MSLKGLEDAALAALDNGGSEGSPGASTEVTDDGQPDPSTVAQEAAPQVEAQEPKTPEALAVADLSKFQEVTINGQKMSIADLQKSIMRQADYTKKTQELSSERKYNANVWADLDKVKSNPALAAEFKRIYPAQYHTALRFVMQGGTPEQAMQQQQPGLSPELEERFNRYDQFIDESSRQKVEAEQSALDATLQVAETNLLKKYPKADAITAYTFADNHRAKLEQETGQKLGPKDIDEKFMEPFFKAAHDYQVKLFNQWQKEMAKTAQNTHRVAADTGRGGGTPAGGPAQKVRLKDVADNVLNGAVE